MQRSILIFSVSEELIEKCERELVPLGFFFMSAHAELPARKILHDIPVDLVLFDSAPEWEISSKIAWQIKGSHRSTPFILMFDSKIVPSRELAAVSELFVGYYNKDAPIKELVIEVARIFPEIRQTQFGRTAK
jgi:DNA-binding NtrC family response regulator